MHYYFGYDGSGNMTQNSRVSADYLGYDASQPHAVSSVRATGGSISPSRCEVGYNSRNRPAPLRRMFILLRQICNLTQNIIRICNP